MYACVFVFISGKEEERVSSGHDMKEMSSRKAKYNESCVFPASGQVPWLYSSRMQGNRHNDKEQKPKQKNESNKLFGTFQFSQRINSRTLNSSIKYHIFRRLLLFLACFYFVLFRFFRAFEYLPAIIYLLTHINRTDKSFYYVYTFIIPFSVVPSI